MTDAEFNEEKQLREATEWLPRLREWYGSQRYTLYVSMGIRTGYPKVTSPNVVTHAYIAISSNSLQFLRDYFEHDSLASQWDNCTAPYYIVDNGTERVCDILPHHP